MYHVVYSIGMSFTMENIQTVVQDVRDTDLLGFCLGVPDSKQNEIKSRFFSVPQQVKAYIDFFMEHDPVASWRAIIVALDEMNEKQAADAIRHLAEPVEGTATGIVILTLHSAPYLPAPFTGN